MSDRTFSETLQAHSEPAWTEATTHRFTRELETGTLSDAVFGRYLRLDYEFVGDLTTVIATAIADAPTMEATRDLTAFLSSVVGPETDYFERAFEALDIDSPELSSVSDPNVVDAFRDLFGHASSVGGYAETLAVLVPVEWVYLTWATAIDEAPETFYHREWVDIHSSDEFASTVSMLRTELDREGETLSPRRRTRVERLFDRAVSLEVAFFEAAYEGDW